MALRVGELFAELKLENKGFDQGVAKAHDGLKAVEQQSERTENATRRLSSAMGDLAKIAGGFVIAKALIELPQIIARAARGAVDAASDISEAQNQVNVVYGSSAGVIKNWASTAADSLGISEKAALSATGAFGAMLTSMNFSQQGAADMSTTMVDLAGDLASFYNIDPGDALEKLKSGLVGETEPLRSVGVLLNEAAVSAKAMELGLADANGELSESAKVTARYALIIEQTKVVQGDFANTSDGMANASRRISAGFEDMSATIGERFLPLIAPLVSRFADALPGAIDRFAAALDRLIANATGFHDWVNGILRDGGTLSGFLDGLPGRFQTAFDNIASAMGVGGYNAITAYAQGMIDSASKNVQAAVDYVASLISDFLVGQSPPPKGPLSEIDKSGQNLMETYSEGMVEGAKGAEAAADTVADAMERVGEKMELDAGRASLEAAEGNLEAMEATAGAVESKLGEIDGELRAIDSQLLQIDRDIADINDKYDDQLAPLQEQLDLLEKQRDLQAEKLQLEQDLARTQVQAASLAALGDPERRAEIAGEMELNDIEQQRLDNASKLADLQGQLDGGGKELTAEERERLELQERGLALSRAETLEKLRTSEDLTGLERQRLQLKLDQIDADIRANQAKQSAKPEELTEAERRGIELQIEELKLRGTLLEMIDAEAAAQAEADGQLLDSKQKEKDLIEEIADINRDIAKIPILEDIEKVEAARRAELEPLEAQRVALQEQREDLDYLRQQWQFLAGDVNAALEPLREIARLQEQAARDAETHANELERAAKAAESEAAAAERTAEAAAKAAMRVDNSYEASQARLSGGGPSCPPGYEMDEFGRCRNYAEEAWQESIRAAGQTDTSQTGESGSTGGTQEQQDVVVPAAGPPSSAGEGRVEHSNEVNKAQSSIWEGLGADAATGFMNRMGEVIKENIGRIMGASIGGGIGALIPGLSPIAAPIGAVIGGLIGGSLQTALEARGIDLSDVQDRIQTAFETHVMPVLERVAVFVEDTVIPAFRSFAGYVQDDLLPAVESFAGVVQDYVIPAAERFFGFLDDHKETILAIGVGVAAAVTAFVGLGAIIGPITAAWASLQGILTVVGVVLMGGMPAVIAAITGALAALLSPVVLIAAAIGLLAVAWMNNWGDIQGKTQAVWNFVRPILEGIQERFNRFTTMILPELREAWGNIQTAITTAAGVIWSVVSTVFNAVAGFVGSHGDTIMKFVVLAWDFISGTINNVLGIVSNIIQAVLNVIQGDWEGAWENVKTILSTVWDQMLLVLNTVIGLVTTYITEALPIIISSLRDWAGAFLGWVESDVLPFIKEKAEAITTWLVSWVKDTALPWIKDSLKSWGSAFIDWVSEQVLGEDGLVSKLGGVARAIFDWIGDKNTGATNLIKSKLLEFATAFLDWIKEGVLGEDGLKSKLGAILTAITDWVNEKKEGAKDLLKDLGTALTDGLESAIKAGLNAIIDVLNGFIGTYNSLSFTTPEIDAGPLGKVGGKTIGVPEIPDIPKLQRGGLTTGTTLAQLHDNEVVLPLGTHGVRALAEALKQAMSSMSIPVPRVSSQMPVPAAAMAASGSSQMDSLSSAISQAIRSGGKDQPIIINQTLTLDGEVIDRRTIRTVNQHADKVYG